jgi:hypothetical protein
MNLFELAGMEVAIGVRGPSRSRFRLNATVRCLVNGGPRYGCPLEPGPPCKGVPSDVELGGRQGETARDS